MSFNPQLIKNGPLGTIDVMLYNSRSKNRKKPSSIYPESWSEFICDLKAIEMMMTKNAEIRLNKNGTSFVITGTTSDGLEIVVHYDIQAKRIKTHHPNIH